MSVWEPNLNPRGNPKQEKWRGSNNGSTEEEIRLEEMRIRYRQWLKSEYPEYDKHLGAEWSIVSEKPFLVRKVNGDYLQELSSKLSNKLLRQAQIITPLRRYGKVQFWIVRDSGFTSLTTDEAITPNLIGANGADFLSQWLQDLGLWFEPLGMSLQAHSNLEGFNPAELDESLRRLQWLEQNCWGVNRALSAACEHYWKEIEAKTLDAIGKEGKGLNKLPQLLVIEPTSDWNIKE